MAKKSASRQQKVDKVCELCSDIDVELSTLQRMHLRNPEVENRIRAMRVELTAVMEQLLDQIDPEAACSIPTHLVRSMAASMDDSDARNNVGLPLDMDEPGSLETVGVE